MIEQCGRSVSFRFRDAAYLDCFAFFAAQLGDGIEMMDRCDVTVRQVDPHGASGIRGK